MSRRPILLLTVLTIALTGTTWPVLAQTRHDGAVPHRKAVRAHKPVAHPARAAREACTKTGCQPLPPGCHITMEETWAGPTGYEIINCP